MASLLLNYKYLSKNQLSGFDNYKYSSIDTSPLSKYVMHPFWDQLVKVCPLWFPANLLTLIGWLLSLFMFILLSYYDPNFSAISQNVPRWVWLVGAVCIFCSHQFDGIDGKQARRTKSGSPLGELFDHGCDSSIVSFMAIGIFSCFGVSTATASELELFFVAVVVFYAFYFSHWEKYTTNVMYLPWAYDISQIWLSICFFATYLYGPELWRTVVYQDYSITQVLKVTLYTAAPCLCVPMSIYNQYVARRDRPEKCVSFFEGLMPMLSLTSVTLVYLYFGYFSHADIFYTNLRLYAITYGIIYANLNCRLIIAQMTNSQCDRFNILAYPLFPMIVCSQLKLVNDNKMLAVYFAFVVLGHIHYGVNVVRQLADHLNVYVFKIGKKPVKAVNGHAYTNGHSNGIKANGKVAQD
ncbi:ethanolaminephosphotransferase 1-like [Clytia hemisphaerica]|uniref:Ethanolaminephosphotransferase n=1 Tax=Clytia hemisphaerica TaxID=252671 RepID=A0A7M5UIE8_9CNID